MLTPGQLNGLVNGFTVICGLLLALSATPAVLAETSQQQPTQAILVLGDSISAGYGIQSEQGWVNLLQEALVQQEYPWHAVNASISGETTGGGLARLQGVMDEHNPAIVVIELGGNDGLRGYPTSTMHNNLRQMVSIVQDNNALPIVVSMRIPPNYGLRYTQAFDAVFAEVARQTNAALVPFILEDVALDRQLMQDDGIHPTAEAQPLLLDAIWPYLQPHL